MSYQKLLTNISGDIQGYCNVISRVLDMDVYIVDESLETIANSTLYQEFETRDNPSTVMKMAAASSELFRFVRNSELDACKACPQYGKNCSNRFMLTVTLRNVQHELIGIIGLIGFTADQEQYFVHNEALIRDFLSQLAELIVSKVTIIDHYLSQKEFVSQLTFVMDKVDDGIIIFEDHTINSINRQGSTLLKMLPMSELQSGDYFIDLQKTGSATPWGENYKLKIGTRDEVEITGSIFVLPIPNKRLLIFRDISAMRISIMQEAATNDSKGLSQIKGNSPQIQNLKQEINKFAASDSTILITGENGTGKELVARALHDLSFRSRKPFVAINCAAIPESLLESELFGYVRGAFTGANPGGKIGKFEMAQGGTIFLDEIGDMPIFMQIKLLRVLESRNIVRLGDMREIPLDVRVIAATNRNLKKLVEQNEFREDLYYRLNVIPIHTPPLRTREGDIHFLASYFLELYAEKFSKPSLRIAPDFFQTLDRYRWPGNVRELRNLMEFTANLVGPSGDVTSMLLSDRIEKKFTSGPPISYDLEENEKHLIRLAAETFSLQGKSNEEIAAILGISSATYYRKIKKYGISV